MSDVHVDNSIKDRAELTKRCGDFISEARIFVAVTVLPDEHVVASSLGIDQRAIPDFLRHAADFIEKEMRRAAIQEHFDSFPPDRRSKCPVCDNEVLLADGIPKDRLNTDPAKRTTCVCACGAFLVPHLIDGALSLRLLTEEEIAVLPDEVRARMVRVRRDLARRREDDN